MGSLTCRWNSLICREESLIEVLPFLLIAVVIVVFRSAVYDVLPLADTDAVVFDPLASWTTFFRVQMFF
jgi:hypothetical protein